MLLGVNIDHVATIRQARLTTYPDPIEAAELAMEAGADLITLHLREDRRHIQDQDVIRLIKETKIPVNLEMATTDEMVQFAEQHQPRYCCLVPERREELTTEGGLDVSGQVSRLEPICKKLSKIDCLVSLFADPDSEQIQAASQVGAHAVELHTGHFANARTPEDREVALARLRTAAKLIQEQGLQAHAGHGLHCGNVSAIASIPEVEELNIGHAIVARAIFVGFFAAVAEMKQLISKASL